jgi:hypothetical protein
MAPTWPAAEQHFQERRGLGRHPSHDAEVGITVQPGLSTPAPSVPQHEVHVASSCEAICARGYQGHQLGGQLRKLKGRTTFSLQHHDVRFRFAF